MSQGLQTPLQSCVQALAAIVADAEKYAHCQFCGVQQYRHYEEVEVTTLTWEEHKPTCVLHFARVAMERSKEAPLAERDPWELALDVAHCIVSAAELGSLVAPRDLAEVARRRIVKLLTTPEKKAG